MPVYQYRCQQCRHLQEAMQKFSDAPLTECEKCGGKLQKIIAPVGIIFKGSGWHINDYKPSAPTDAKPAAETQDKTETPASGDTPAPSTPAEKPAAAPEKPASPPPSSSQKQVA